MTVELLLVLKLTILFIYLYSILFIFLKRVFEGSGTWIWSAVFVNTALERYDVVCYLIFYFTFQLNGGQHAPYLSALFHICNHGGMEK